jgi:hypothetical protein
MLQRRFFAVRPQAISLIFLTSVLRSRAGFLRR